jgi:hypothetical protein
MSDRGDLFGSSTFCGAEDPDQPGWLCVKSPGHEAHGYGRHLYGQGIRLGEITDRGPDRGPASQSPPTTRPDPSVDRAGER